MILSTLMGYMYLNDVAKAIRNISGHLQDDGVFFCSAAAMKMISRRLRVCPTMHEDIIHISAEREDVVFHGHLHLPMKVKPKNAEAKFSSGLLRVEVQLKEKRSPPTRIEVK